MSINFKNTDFFIEDIDKSVKDLAVDDTSVSYVSSNTDFFIENIDNNVIEICVDRGITPNHVSVTPANTDFFIINIDTNVKKIASDLNITPSTVQNNPSNTDFYIENIYFNLILICEELNIEPYEITVTPTNTDFFIEAIAKNVEQIMENQTELHVSGTFIHAVLSVDSEIIDYELDGNATQDGTPTPDSPVTINTVTGEQTLTVTGKNLLDVSASYRGTWDNSGNTTTCTFFMPIQNGQTFTISNQDTTTWRFSAGLSTNPSNNPVGTGSQISAWQTGASYTITAQKTAYLWVQMRKNANTAITLSDLPTDVFMVELGSTATTFDPYQAQISTIQLGKNLLNPDENVWQQGFYNYNGSGQYTSNNNYRVCQIYKQKVEEETTYSVQLPSNMAFRVDGWKLDGTYLGQNAIKAWYDSSPTPTTFTVPANSYFAITLGAKSNGFQFNPSMVKNFEIQVEYGSTASTYEAYGTVFLGKIGDYQDKIYYDVDTSKWMLHKEIGKTIFNGSENWGYTSGAHPRFSLDFSSLALGGGTGSTPIVMSDYFVGSDVSTIYAGKDLAIGAHASLHAFWIRYDAITSASDFKTWLTSNPTTVYYALATATDTEITNETLIEQLNSIFETELKEGVINIMITTPPFNLPANLKATIKPKE